MKNEKKLWLLEQYSQKLWNISLALITEAARAGEHGRGYAIVSFEARIVADKLNEFVGDAKFGSGAVDFAALTSITLQLQFLCVNAELETINGVDKSMEFNIPKSMAVFAEQLRRISWKMQELCDDHAWRKPFVLPELADPVDANELDCFLLFTVGGHTLIENMRNIREVQSLCRCITDADTHISLRGEEIPLFDVYKKLGLPMPGERWQPIFVLEGKGGLFAVPADDIEIGLLEFSPKGRPHQAAAGHAFADFARECWALTGGEQAIFVDWEKLRG